MKQCRDIQALHAFARLKDSTPLMTYLTESKQEAMDKLVDARSMDDAARQQAEIGVIEQILKYVREGEVLAAKYQTK